MFSCNDQCFSNRMSFSRPSRVSCCPIPAPLITTSLTEVCSQAPTIGGLGIPGAIVFICINDQIYSAIVNSSYEWQITVIGSLPLGNNFLWIWQVFNGRCSTRVCQVLNVMNTTIIITFPGAGSQINTATPLITGLSQPGNVITVLLNGVTYNTVADSVTGLWSVQVTTPLADGTYSLIVTATGTCGTAQTVVGFSVLALTATVLVR